MFAGAARLRQWILEDLAAMSAPLSLARDTRVGESRPRASTCLRRHCRSSTTIRYPRALSERSHRRTALPADSLHILVMDLHKAINALQAGLAEESIDGARVWGIEPGGPPFDPRVHVRSQRDGSPQVRSSGTRRRSRRAPAPPRHRERHRHDRRACAGAAHRRIVGDIDLHRCACAAAAIFSEPVQALRRALGRYPGAPQRAPRRRTQLLSEHRPLRCLRREDARALSGVPRFAHRFPDRLEPRTQTAAGVLCARAMP